MKRRDQRSSRIFVLEKLSVFFKHTDYHGFLHPYNYFEWTSYVREEFFIQKCSGFRKMLDMSIRMMTTKIEADIHNSALFGDVIQAQLFATKIRKLSLEVTIEFLNKEINKMLATTRHSLVFFDEKDKRLIPIPEKIKIVATEYLLADEQDG